MKKLLTIGLVAGTVSSLAACKKKVEPVKTDKTKTTEIKTKTATPVARGNVAQGSYKIGYAGSNVQYTGAIKAVLTQYTQDIESNKLTGEEYFNLPSGLFLNSSDKFNSFIREDEKYKNNTKLLKAWLLGFTQLIDGNEKPDDSDPLSISSADNGVVLTQAQVEQYVYTTRVIEALFEALKGNTRPTDAQLYGAFQKAQIFLPLVVDPTGVKKPYKFTLSTGSVGAADNAPGHAKISFRDHDKEDVTMLHRDYTSFKTVYDNFKSKETVEEMISDKTKLASKHQDALFVHVTDGTENSQDIYKSIVEKKEFKDTNLFFMGDKAKSQTGASSKVFAGEKVSTATFNKYAAAYIAGFQAAVGTIKYSSSEDEYEETTVSFLIGATSDSASKKKAFAFRRGVEAAAAHKAYSAFLKVKFVSKTEDSSKSSKKLYREVSEWRNRDDSKSKLYEFASSDTFSDADRRVIYISGTTAHDWRGEDTNVAQLEWGAGDNTGLIGALYNSDKPTAAKKTYDALSSKSFSRGVWVVLDREKEDDYTANDLLTGEDQEPFERRQVRLLGFVGGKLKGTQIYAKFALGGLYMGGANYMLGKHTVFGSSLDLSSAVGDKKAFSDGDDGVLLDPIPEDLKLQPWLFKKDSKDSTTKIESRYDNSLKAAWSVEIVEEVVTKQAPWMK